MWDVCIEILNDLSQAPGDDITTLNGKCSFPLAAAGVTVDQPWSRARVVVGGFSCRSRDARFVFVELTVWGCLLTDGDRDGCVVTLCRAYVLSVPELVNMLLLLLLFFFKVVGLFFFNLTKIIPTWAQRMGGLWALEKRSRPAGCWRVALEALQLWNVQNPDASWKNQRWGSTISHTTMILHDLFIIFGPETWSREPLGCGRQIFAAPPSVACGDVTLCFVINQRFLVNILNSLSEF